jgi:DNA-binding response OmpR family regulator
MRVLVADCDPRRQVRLQERLAQVMSGVEALCTSTREDTLDVIRRQIPDVVLLAAELGNGESLAVLCSIRRISAVPVLVISSSNQETYQIRALRLGADDYVVRPVSPLVLAARVEAVLRRGRSVLSSSKQPDLHVGELELWSEQREARLAGSLLPLSPLEFRLLRQLAERAGSAVPSEVLLDQVWGGSHAATTKYLKVFVNRLRLKLAAQGHAGIIETRRGVGYRLALTPR